MITRLSLLGLCLMLSEILLLSCSRPSRPSDPIEAKIDALLAKMTLEEKVGQTALRGASSRYPGALAKGIKEQVRAGKIGAFLNVMDKSKVAELQQIAVEESRLGIPLLFGRDVIHGFRTIFPIPLGLAATWNPQMGEQVARISAQEASTYGIRWTFAPMMDIARDPRWGRIAESFGEDPYLASRFAAAMVRGFQTDDLTQPTSLAATAKHFAGYGAAEGGRDYNTTWIPQPLLRNVYLRPFHAAIQAGASSVMSGFNDLNGVPVTANHFLLTQVLRDEWHFEGFVVSDWNSLSETVVHGYARDAKHAAQLTAHAGLDMEMNGTAYEEHVAVLIEEGRVSQAQLDAMVRHILRIKYRLGLFDRSHFDASDEILLNQRFLQAARQAAVESFVLLKNQGDLLPLSAHSSIAVVGPMADAPHEQLGTWTLDGNKADSRTPLQALRERLGDKMRYAQTLAISRSKSHEHFGKALAAAAAADVVIVFAGEEAILSGEAHCRADLRLPGAQEDLIRALARSKTPIVLVLMAGRPITLADVLDEVAAVVVAWHPGTMAGPALADVLLGDASPSGKLPVSWPRAVGQVPIHYNHKNTGRPAYPATFVHLDDIPVEAWQTSLGNQSHYLDIGYEPQFPFGYGLSYTSFAYDELRLSQQALRIGETLEISARVQNTGKRAGTEIVQLYARDLVGSITRPVRELKGFQRVTLAPGEARRVSFVLHSDDLAFYGADGLRVIEPGLFKVWIAPHAAAGLEASFELHR